MKQLPKTQNENALVLRTDFSDDAIWQSVCAAIQRPVGGFKAYVDCVSDPEYDGITVEQVLSLVSQDATHAFIFIVDRIAISNAEHPILVVDLYPEPDTEPGQTFRVIPAQMAAVENNLSIANVDFEEFADAAHPGGIFRGFDDTDV